MKIFDRKLLGYSNLGPEQREDLEKFILKDFQHNTENAFMRFLMKPIVGTMLIVIGIIFLGLGGLALLEGLIFTFSTANVLWIGLFVTIGLSLIVLSFLGEKWRIKRVDRTSNQFDMNKITRKFFSYYGFKDEDINIDDIDAYKETFRYYRNAPKDATISDYHGVLRIKDDKFQVAIANVNWQWEEEYQDGDGDWQVETINRRQIFVITSGFNDSWRDVSFALKRILDNKDLKRRKKAKLEDPLENDDFNHNFDYLCNNPVKLRRILTPAIQETLLERANINGLHYSLQNGFLIASCTPNDVKFDFTPFEVEIQHNNTSIAQIKNLIHTKIIEDLHGVVNLIAHTNIFYSIYK